MHTAFVCPLVPFRVASYVLRLFLLLLVSLLLATLVEHLFEELELCEGYARQRAYQGQKKKAHRQWCRVESKLEVRGQLGLCRCCRAEIAKTNLFTLRAPSLSQFLHPLNSPLKISDASSTNKFFITGKALPCMHILPSTNTQVHPPPVPPPRLPCRPRPCQQSRSGPWQKTRRKEERIRACSAGQHHIPTTWHALVPRRKLRHGPRPYHLREREGLCDIL